MTRAMRMVFIGAIIIIAPAVGFTVALSLSAGGEAVIIDTATGCPERNAGACLEAWALDNIDDIENVIEVLTDRTLTDEDFYTTSCHDVWHSVGESAVLVHDLTYLLSIWPYSCYGGLMHGAMAIGAQEMGYAAFSEIAPDLCRMYTGRSEVVELDCWHGVGHGLAYSLEFPQSMEACVPLTSDVSFLSWCTWGATETHFIRYAEEAELLNTVTVDFLRTCETLDMGQDVCLRMVGPLIIVAGYTFEDMYDYCSTTSGQYAQWCAFSAGQIAATDWMTTGADPNRCAQDPVLADACARGAGTSVGRTEELSMSAIIGAGDGPPTDMCRVFAEQRHQQICQDSANDMLDLELSLDELSVVTRTWWSDDAGTLAHIYTG